MNSTENTKNDINAGENTVMLEIAGGAVDVFDPSIEGVSPITKSRTSIPAANEPEVKKSARQHGVSVRRAK